MREHDDVALKDYTFTMAEEVREKIKHVDNLHELISEESVVDLHRVDVTDGIYLTIKRLMDILFAVLGLMILLIPILIVAATVYLDDPGEVIFSQNRVGQHGRKFKLYKFRTMKMETPKDVPTHLLENPEQYITRVGKILRKTSLDELPQIFQIFTGEMSIIGPRPALWNQFDLIAERDKYGANDVRPGLTGWAQINGRDELPIDVKARFDGEYVEKLSFAFDCKCFFGTIASVLKSDGVVEGGTGQLDKENGKK